MAAPHILAIGALGAMLIILLAAWLRPAKRYTVRRYSNAGLYGRMIQARIDDDARALAAVERRRNSRAI